MMTDQLENISEPQSNLAVPPGEYLEEVLHELGMSKEDLAQRLDRPASKLSAIYKGHKSITPDTALRLEKVVGVPAYIWTGLQEEYDLTLARQKAEQHAMRLKSETKLINKYCYKELVVLGEVQKKTDPIEKLNELLNYFGTVTLSAIPKLSRYQPAYRLGKIGKHSPEALAAWIRLGERRASRVECNAFNKKLLTDSLYDIRAMTLKPPKQFIFELTDLLSNCGIVFVLTHPFTKTKAHGATFQFNEHKIVLMLTNRMKWADVFWFSLFHELGHILKHSLKEVIIENEVNSQREKEADHFASEVLIPDDHYQTFLESGSFTQSAVKKFAKEINIHPGIVVGRLQHDKKIKHNQLNHLRQRYV